jgi:hypothetical protein
MTDDVRKLVKAAVGVSVATLVAVFTNLFGAGVSGQAANCGMILNDTPPIFCDTFDQPHPVTNRSGQLDGVVWGVSRADGGGLAWKQPAIDNCDGTRTLVSPPHDVIICNGQLRQATDDGGGVTVLAMYPKQPFDWANRTGTVAFDITNDNSGSHGAWPEFWISDTPVPAPFTHSHPCDFCSVPKHALGIRFAGNLGDCPGGWRADSAVVIRNYVVEDRNIFEGNTSGMRIQQTGCASLSSGPNGALNHIELRISQNTIDVYASDAGSRNLRRINTITNANLSFTRGLIWLEDAHYNADKGQPGHQNHTFTWDNVAFDGPPTYRDLSFDVLDRLTPHSQGWVNIGWPTTPSGPVTLNTLPMTAQNIAAAKRALFMFNFGHTTHVNTFNYSINGHAVSVPNPIPLPLRGERSVAFEVPLSHLVAGPQNIVISGDQNFNIRNVNIVLVDAAPVPGFNPPAPPANLRILSSSLRELRERFGLLPVQQRSAASERRSRLIG